jgi:agmatine deiminase
MPTAIRTGRRDEVEAELHRMLGTHKAIWLPRGLEADLGPFGTDGHIDTLACFLKPGVVVVHDQPDPAHPDFEASREFRGVLEAATDAQRAAGSTLFR